tara:strand:+ start:1291 stop:1527 length:237 start_codon:yes stop_codon:yes gene_type:complete
LFLANAQGDLHPYNPLKGITNRKHLVFNVMNLILCRIHVNTKTIIGGLFGGLWDVELAKKHIGENKLSADLFVFPIIT